MNTRALITVLLCSSHWSPKVDSVLSERITHFLERAYVLDREGRPESEVPLLQLLSKPMQRELRFARFEGCLRCWDQNLQICYHLFFFKHMPPSVQNQRDFDMPLAIVTYDQGFDWRSTKYRSCGAARRDVKLPIPDPLVTCSSFFTSHKFRRNASGLFPTSPYPSIYIQMQWGES